MISPASPFVSWISGSEEPSAARWTIGKIARQGETKQGQKSKEFAEKGAEVPARHGSRAYPIICETTFSKWRDGRRVVP